MGTVFWKWQPRDLELGALAKIARTGSGPRCRGLLGGYCLRRDRRPRPVANNAVDRHCIRPDGRAAEPDQHHSRHSAADGRPPASVAGSRHFMFATGIENSYTTIQLPDGTTKRVDEMEKTGHYRHWREDFQLVEELGIRFLRYGPPFYRTHVDPGKYHWDFADETFNELRKLKIEPIADLCHFGVPDWIENFQNPDFPKYFAEYAAAFANRFPWFRLYTPVNEILIATLFSGRYGWWNERPQSDRAFVTAPEAS